MSKSTPAILSMAAMSLWASAAAAQPSFGGEIGTDMWFGSTKIDEVRRDKPNMPVVYAALEHDLPYLPNASIRYTSVDADFTGFDKYDFTFYYKVLERELMTFDAGVTLTNYSNSHYRTQDVASSRYSFDETTFNWYAYGELYVPNTNFDIFGQFDFGSSKGIKSADVTAGLQYLIKFDDSHIALRGGYRVIDLEFTDLGPQAEDTPSPLVFVDGWFIGAEYNF